MTEPMNVAEERASRSGASRQRRSARAIAAERQRQQSRVRWIGIAVAAVVVVAIVGFFLYQRQQNTSTIPEGTLSYSYPGAQHSTEPVTYTENPPVGGVHSPTWQNCGFYAAPIPNETAVHSLEHGAVWITFQPDLPQEQIDVLRNLAQSQSYILVSPKEGIPTPVVASAWGKQIQLESADDPRLDQFVRAFRLSREAPEPGAACVGGTSETQ
jgi:hypothetical protein